MSTLSLVQIEGWTLAAGGFEDGVPRVRDLELAAHLEYGEPVNIRKLIRGLAENGRLGIVSAKEIIRTGPGRPGSEFWLTEAQALKVAAKSDTAKADDILDELIRVFLLLRDHAKQAPPMAFDSTAMLELFERRFESLMRPFLETMSNVTKTLSALSGATIPPLEANALLCDVRQLAAIMVQAGVAKNENSARRRIYNRLSGALGWFGTGRNWRALPLHKLQDAKVLLAEMRRELGHVPSPQLSLLPGGKA